MIKLYLAVFFLYIVNWANGQTNQIHPNVESLEKSVVVVKIYDKYNQFKGYGSGVIIDTKGTCITCYHVLEDAYYAKILTQHGDEFEMDKIVAENSGCDLIKFIIINPDKAIFTPVKISKARPQKAEDVWAMGTPDDINNINQISHGGITNIFVVDNVKIIQTDAKIAHGSSGGGLFNSAGELIGITGGKFRGDDATLAGRNIAISVTAFSKLYSVSKDRLESAIPPPVVHSYESPAPEPPKYKMPVIDPPKYQAPEPKYEYHAPVMGKVSFYTDWSKPIEINIDGNNGITRSYFAATPNCGQDGTITFSIRPGTYYYSATSSYRGFWGTRVLTWTGSVTLTSDECRLVKITNTKSRTPRSSASSHDHNNAFIRTVKYTPYLLLPGCTDKKLSKSKLGNLKMTLFFSTAAISILSRYYSNSEYSKYSNSVDPSSNLNHYNSANLANKVFLTSGGIVCGIYAINLVEFGAKFKAIKNKINKK